MSLAILAVSVSIHAVLLLAAKRWDRVFAGVLFFSHVYFCVGGYYYWVVIGDGYFVGSRWAPDELLFGISALSLCTTAFCAFSTVLRRAPRFPMASSPAAPQGQMPLPKVWWIFAALGSLAGLVVMAQILNRQGLRGEVSLMAYQISDCLIPVIAFYVAAKGLKKEALAALAIFVIYASIVGFRYKIALVAIPVLSCIYYSNVSTLRKTVLLGWGVVITLTLFSLMTLFRNKFSGISFEGASEKTFDQFIYGLFAETNIIFGLSAVNAEFLFKGNAIGLVPMWDMIKEWIPRAFYPTRTSGEYLAVVGLGLYTEQGAQSGTAYPNIGEFIIMFGWPGLFLAPIFLAVVYRGITSYVARWSPSSACYAGAVGILAAMLCYYNYSRGYLPQISKAYICVLLPYVLMVRQTRIALAGAKARTTNMDQLAQKSPILGRSQHPDGRSGIA